MTLRTATWATVSHLAHGVQLPYVVLAAIDLRQLYRFFTFKFRSMNSRVKPPAHAALTVVSELEVLKTRKALVLRVVHFSETSERKLP